MVTGGGVEGMDLGSQACFGTIGLLVSGCVTLGKIFKIQFLDLKMERYKYMLPTQVILNETIYIKYLAQGGDLINGNCYYHLF